MATKNDGQGISLIRSAFLGEATQRAPWVPFVGCHAAALLGISAEDYLKSVDLMHRGLSTAIERYQPDGIPVAFDLQIEAETLGCDLKWSADTPPSVRSHPLADGKSLADLSVPGPDLGRIPLVLDVTRRLRAEHPDLALYGLVTGPFTLALHLLGTDIFMKMFDAPEFVEELLNFCSEVGLAMSQYYLEAGCDVIAVVDPMTSQIGPDQFAEFVTPYTKPLFDKIREKNALGSFFVCGHAQQNVESMCKTGAHNLCVDENIPLDFVRDVCRQHGLSFGGNLQLTTVLLLGKPEDAEKNAMECLRLGEQTGFVLAPGCDIAYDTPSENLEAIGKLIHDPYRQETVAALAETRTLDDVLDMSEYGRTEKVIVDIITLDSEACAPCQYMVEAVQRITPEFEGIVQWREHKIKYREEIVFMTSLMVKNVPTICIDGQITFVSQIPPRDELIAAIQKRINQKMRDRIREQHASVFVLGESEEACEETRQGVERAITELGSDVTVSVVTDPFEIRRFGIPMSQTPAVVTAKYRVQSTQSLPPTAIIKEWIKTLA
ncbi:uroporphyrinogen decarboxylase family protein [Novipirellula artificiosorum]|uniref:Uroporphyrinogen decarboxylase n=1 Tax=Novipirellula artificiosorum TaxID=2528016 RepID=A0A5C6DHE2_9BACT|nr:uroporphyrinogen decarboxylase family protein [Novipirellula artificiosorum]TWU35121.1 Uroporphyrinogen decarboxylase [Novipirellula artificiosorum]